MRTSTVSNRRLRFSIDQLNEPLRIERLAEPVIDALWADGNAGGALIHAADGIDLQAVKTRIAAEHAHCVGASQPRKLHIQNDRVGPLMAGQVIERFDTIIDGFNVEAGKSEVAGQQASLVRIVFDNE